MKLASSLVWVICALGLGVTGCDSKASVDIADVGPEATTDTLSRDTTVIDAAQDTVRDAPASTCSGIGGAGDTAKYYLLNFVRIPDVNGEDALGFNLDGFDSGTTGMSSGDCSQMAPDFEDGVDNNFGRARTSIDNLLSLVNMPGINATLQGQVNMGNFLFIFRVDGIDDYINDNSVTVQLFTASTSETLDLTGAGLNEWPSGMNNFTITPSSAVLSASIANGKLAFRSMEIPLMTSIGSFVVTDAQISANISATSLSSGVVGGAILKSQIMSEVSPTYWPIVEGNLTFDLLPQSGMPLECDAISAGFNISGVSVDTPTCVVR